MVAEKLVELDEIRPVLLEPGCEALVEVGAGRPSAARRTRRRGCRMWRKRKPSSPASCGRSGVISSLRTSAASRGVTLGLVGRERLDGAAVEDLALDRPALEHAPLGGLELVEARGEQRRSVGGTTTSPSTSAPSRPSPRRRAGCRPAARAILPRSSSVEPLGDQLVDVLVASGSSRSVTGHVGRRSTSSGPRDAEQRGSARPSERSATCSIRSRNVSSPHWMSSKTTTSGARAAACSSVLRNAHAISSAEVARVALAEEGADRRRDGLVRAEETSSCFSTSTTGQYVIPSP